MRALVKAKAGAGFVLEDVPRPRIRDDEVLIQVRRAGVCGTDVHIYEWDAWAQGRCRPPFTVGHEFAGDVVEVGRFVTDVKEGDRVTAEGHIVCGRCHLCRTGNAHVCPNTRIIASDVNQTRLALARTMGAHDAVTPQQAEGAVRAATGGLGVDVVLEMSGVPSAIHQAFALVRVGGRVQMLGIPAKPMEVDFATEIIFRGITVYGVVGRRMYDTWIQMTQFLRSGQFDPTPVITHRFPLEQFDDAIAAIKGGEAGKVVFEIS